MCRTKGPLWPAIAHLLTTSVTLLAPPTNANYARSTLFAKANIGFRLFAEGLGPRACGPAVHMKSPSPLGARFVHYMNKSAFTQCWDFMLS